VHLHFAFRFHFNFHFPAACCHTYTLLLKLIKKMHYVPVKLERNLVLQGRDIRQLLGFARFFCKHIFNFFISVVLGMNANM